MTENTRVTLRRIAESYADGLGLESRRRVIQASMRARRESSGWSWRSARTLWPQMAVAGVMMAVLALPAFFSGGPGPSDLSPIHDLQVGTQAGKVILTWSDGGQPRKIVRATSRTELAHLGDLPAEVVTGERWVDDAPATEEEPIVFYVVE